MPGNARKRRPRAKQLTSRIPTPAKSYGSTRLPFAPAGELQILHIILFARTLGIFIRNLKVSRLPFLKGGGAIMEQRKTRINPSEETIGIGPLGIRFLLTGEDSNGSASVFEVLVPVGQKLPAPAHKNDAYEEILYGIEGVLTWTVDGTPIEVGPGQALCIPRGAVHRFDNLGSEDVKQLAVISPAVMGPAYFREAAEVIGAAAGGPPDRAKMMDVFRRHGMTLAAPPPAK